VNNLYLRTDWGVVDILSTVAGIGDFEKLKVHAESITIAGKLCRLIGLEDLIKAKEAIGRDKDLQAVKERRVIAAKKSTVVKKRTAPWRWPCVKEIRLSEN